MRRIVKRAAAKRDLILHFAFIAERTPDAVERVIHAKQDYYLVLK